MTLEQVNLRPHWEFPTPPFDRKFYEDLRRARPNFRRVEDFIISVEEGGKAFIVKKGQSVRIICVEGAQIADVWFYNANDYLERYWDGQSFNREGAFLTTFSRIWSIVPKFRPMMTIIEDTVENKPTHPGSGHHSQLTANCNPHYWYWAFRDNTHPYVTTFNCYYNWIRAVEPFGLGPEHLHNNVCLFQKMFFTEEGRHVTEGSDAEKGDYVEFYAEMDILMAISICPNGSGRLHWSVREQDIKPFGIEIYDTGVEPLEFEDVLADEAAHEPQTGSHLSTCGRASCYIANLHCGVLWDGRVRDGHRECRW